MKKEQLEALKGQVREIGRALKELTDEELTEVLGGMDSAICSRTNMPVNPTHLPSVPVLPINNGFSVVNSPLIYNGPSVAVDKVLPQDASATPADPQAR